MADVPDRAAPTPWLTVITVVKDDAAGFARTLASLARQDLTGVEYLVIDSSSEGSAIASTLAGSGIAGIYAWVEPAGIYAAMNAGLDRAHGDYAYFANAGDVFASDDTLAGVRHAVERSTPEWLYGEVCIVGQDGTRTTTPTWDFEAERSHAFSRGLFPCHQGTFARTDLLRAQGGFDTSYAIVADYVAFLKLAQAAAPVHLDDLVAEFHEGGVSTQHWRRSALEFHRARRSVLGLRGRAALTERWHTARGLAAASIYRSVWPIAGALAVLTWLLMTATGVAPAESARLTGLVAIQAVTGAMWWRLVQPRRHLRPMELVGMGIALGSSAATVAGLVGLWWLPTLLVVLTWLGRRMRTGPAAGSLPWDRPTVLALIAGLIPGIGAYLYAIRAYPLTWTGMWTGYHGDMDFFEALSTSMANYWPDSIFMSGAQFRYHVLAYAWSGQVTAAGDAAPFVVLVRLLPLVTLVATIALSAASARRLSRNAWVPSLAVLLIIAGGFVGATYGTILNFDSPSQSWSIAWLLALSIAFGVALRRSTSWWVLAPLAVLGFILVGGKVSTAAVAFAAIALVVFLGLVLRRSWRWRALLAVIAVAVSGFAAYMMFLAGPASAGGLGLFSLLDRASSVQGLNPVATPRGIVAGIALLALAIVPRWAGLMWLGSDPRTRLRPVTLYGIGLALAGLATVFVLSGGFNDLWFALAASAPLAVLSAVGAGRAAESIGAPGRPWTRLALALGLLVAVLSAAVWATGSTGIIGQGWRWSAPLVGVLGALVATLVTSLGYWAARDRSSPESSARTWQAFAALAVISLVATSLPSRIMYPIAESVAPKPEGTRSPVVFSPETHFVQTKDTDHVSGWTDRQAAAGQWLRGHSSADDLVATNVTGSPLVPALSARQTFVSAVHYQAPYGRAADLPTLLEREQQSWAAIDSPSVATFAPLCAAGVRWLWVDPARTDVTDWVPYAEIAWAAADAVILRVLPAACP